MFGAYQLGCRNELYTPQVQRQLGVPVPAGLMCTSVSAWWVNRGTFAADQELNAENSDGKDDHAEEDSNYGSCTICGDPAGAGMDRSA